MGLFSRSKNPDRWRIKEDITISFGSGYCRLAYILKGIKDHNSIIRIDDNRHAMIPAIAFYNHEVFYGSEALEQSTSNMRNLVQYPQRLIGRAVSDLESELMLNTLPTHQKNGELFFEFTQMPPRHVIVNGSLSLESVPKKEDLQRSALQLVSMIFKELKRVVEHKREINLKRATLILPLNIDERQQNAYRVAAALAGLEVYITFDAVSFMTRLCLDTSTKISLPRLVLYIDLSKNCSDITLLEISRKKVTQLKTLHDVVFCGDEFTSALQENVLQLAFQTWKIKTARQPFNKLLELYYHFEECKKQLSSLKCADISINSKFFGKEFKTTVTPQQYDLYCAPLLKYFETLLEKFFTLTNYTKDQIHSIYFVGGGTRYSLASDTVKKVFRGVSELIIFDSAQFMMIAEGAVLTKKFLVSTSMNCVNNPFTDIIETYNSHQLFQMKRTNDFKIDMSLKKRETAEDTPAPNQTSQNSASRYQSMQHQRDNAKLNPTASGNTLLESMIPAKMEKGNMLESNPEPRVKGNARAEPATSPPPQSYKGMLLEQNSVKNVPDIGTLSISTPSATRKTKAVGISLGNYNGVVTVQTRAVANEEGSIVTPCFVTFDDDGPIVGAYAKHSLASRPANTLPLCDVISLAGYPFESEKVRAAIKTSPYALVEKDGQVAVQVEINDELEIFSLDDIVTLVLKELATLALSQGTPSHTVFAVPNDWNREQEHILLSQSLRLGLGQVSFISDGKAIVVAMNFLVPHSAEGSNCLVVDIGARALNVFLLRKTDGFMHAVGTKSSGDLGGSQVDELLMQHFLSVFKKQHNKEIPVDVYPRLQLYCEAIKQRVSAADPDNTVSITIHGIFDYTDIELSLTHSLLNEICKGLFDGVVEIISQVLVQAKLEKNQIDDLVFTGGGTSIPGMRNAVESFFEGKQAATLLKKPQEYSSYGAAVYAESLEL